MISICFLKTFRKSQPPIESTQIHHFVFYVLPSSFFPCSTSKAGLVWESIRLVHHPSLPFLLLVYLSDYKLHEGKMCYNFSFPVVTSLLSHDRTYLLNEGIKGQGISSPRLTACQSRVMSVSIQHITKGLFPEASLTNFPKLDKGTTWRRQ